MGQSEYWAEFMRRRLSRRRLLQAGTVAGTGLLVGSALGCANSGETAKSPTPSTTQGAATQGTAAPKPLTGQVTVAHSSAIFYQTGGDSHTQIGGLGPLTGDSVGEPLVGLNVDLTYFGALASSWKYSADMKTVDFVIRKGVPFHNGALVTPQDVKFSIERAMRPDLKLVIGYSYRNAITGIDLIGDDTVRLTLKDPYPGLFKRLWWDLPIYPQKYCEQVGDAGVADKPISAGPFKWVDYKQDQYMVFEAVPNHYRQTPGFKTLKYIYGTDDSTRLAMLKTGEVDIATLSGPMVEQVKADPNLKILEIKYTMGTNITYCDMMFPNEPSPFLNLKVRQAVNYAIDRETICKKVLFGLGAPTAQALCPYHLGYDKNFKEPAYDPKLAKSLLAEAGYPNGVDVTFNLVKTNQYVVEALAANLAEAGIRVKMNVMEAGAYQTALMNRTLRGLILQISYYDVERNPAADIEDGFRTNNLNAYFSNPDVEAALDKAQAATSDEEVAKWGAELNKMIYDQQLKTQLWGTSTAAGYRADKILKWESQNGSVPLTRWEYMQVKV